MKIEDVRNQLIDGLEEEYTKEQINTIDNRLQEIANENGLTIEQLNEFCWANSSEMFTCIFNGKEFNPSNFEVD